MNRTRILKSGMKKMWQALGLICLIAFTLGPSRSEAQQYTWTDVPRIVAISDPHGAYEAMVGTLANAEVIDGDRNWSGGDTHLVVTGDLMDRGADSRKVMDLVMQLEEQALAAGGMVHLLLGNHEVMNLVGDLRYVAAGEYAAFADDESEEERERWFRIFAAQQLNIGEPDEEALRAEFNKLRPPGFFGHREAFSSEGKYGKWLLGKPLVVVVNGNAFVHGGLPPLVAELGLDGLNNILGSQVSEYVAQMGVLNKAGLFDPVLSFYQHAEEAKSLAVMTTLPAEVNDALQIIIELNDSNVHTMQGPLWYRGNVGCGILVEGDRLTAALRAVGAERVVIGHTPTQTREVLARLDGRVIEIDTGMLDFYYKGSGHALIIENGELWVASEHTTDLKRVVQHPRRVGYRPGSLTATNLEYILTNGEILSSTTDEAGRKIVELRGDDATITAVFSEDENRKGLNPEIAAYRLDRLINLDMVPVTVAREVDGDKGSLQFVPKNTRDEQYRSTSGSGGGAWCPLPEQWGAMYIFDKLAADPRRQWQDVWRQTRPSAISQGRATGYQFLLEAGPRQPRRGNTHENPRRCARQASHLGARQSPQSVTRCSPVRGHSLIRQSQYTRLPRVRSGPGPSP
jgi:hypothetical protein